MRISDWSSDVCSSDLLEREHAQLAGAVLGQEGLVALDVEVAREILNAACALPAAMLRLDEFEPRFQPVIVDGGADRIVFLEFDMAIMRGRCADAHPLEPPAAGIDLAVYVQGTLDDTESPRCLLLAQTGPVTAGD